MTRRTGRTRGSYHVMQLAQHVAARVGVPYVHREGTLVVLVLGDYNSQFQLSHRMCPSEQQARLVASTVIAHMQQFPERDPLAVAAMYAEAAVRHAHWSARREHWRAA